MLGSRGVDLPKLTQKLESLSARKSFEPLNPVADTDVEGYLKNERENAIIAVIEEINKNVSEYWISIHYHMYKPFARITCRSSNQLNATRSAACTPSGAMRRSVC